MLSETGIRTSSLDHVALWVNHPQAIADFLDPLEGMHVIEQTSDFTLIGGDAREGKLTLFASEGEREPGILGRIALRVRNLDEALESLHLETSVERRGGAARFSGPEGIPLALVEDPGAAVCDLDHLELRVTQPDEVRAGLGSLGFVADGAALRLGSRRVLLEPGPPPSGDPLLNHIALLIDSGQEALAEVQRRGIEVTAIKDTQNTYAFFIAGPERISIEYVEHKPTFSLT